MGRQKTRPTYLTDSSNQRLQKRKLYRIKEYFIREIEKMKRSINYSNYETCSAMILRYEAILLHCDYCLFKLGQEKLDENQMISFVRDKSIHLDELFFLEEQEHKYSHQSYWIQIFERYFLNMEAAHE